MKPLALFLSLLLPGFASVAQTAHDMGKLQWLAGRWNRLNVKAGQEAHERWEKVSDGEWQGWGVSLSGDDTVFVEKLKIIARDAQLYYVAEMAENAAPVWFRFTSLTAVGFTCENPGHDFPKKIEYRLGNDRLTATISGDGRSIPFLFVKVK